MNEAHFEVISKNKSKSFEAKKTMTNMNDFHNNKAKIMLVDGDLLAYKITSSLEEPIDWGNDVWTLHSDLGKGKTLLQQTINHYKEKTQSAEVIFAFSDKNNFRKDVLPTYKSNRKENQN